jgi:predicted ester cyclase
MNTTYTRGRTDTTDTTDAATTSTSSADVKDVARRVLEEIFPANDEAALLATLSDEFVNHEAPAGVPRGPESVAFFMRMLAGAFSEQRWTMHQVLAEGDTVVLYCTHSGKHTGNYMGLPPTERDFSYRQMHMIRVVDGKGVEHWAVRDDAALMRQLTAPLSAPTAPPGPAGNA